jgi:hypothetical protein
VQGNNYGTKKGKRNEEITRTYTYNSAIETRKELKHFHQRKRSARQPAVVRTHRRRDPKFILLNSDKNDFILLPHA